MPHYAHFQLHVLQLLDSFTCFGSSPFKNTFLSSDWMPLTLEGLNSMWVGLLFSQLLIMISFIKGKNTNESFT